MTTRTVQRLIPAMQASDGAGVKIKRSLGQNQHTRLDPFLMLDFFGSDQAGDYIKGFPPHPHRGFETVTYMLAGHMLHEDHLGNQGHLKSGGVQWMTAGRGIIHSEMPQQDAGLMQGFQLWLNLPAAEKMKPAAYVDISPELIPQITLAQGTAKVIARELDLAEDTIKSVRAGGIVGVHEILFGFPFQTVRLKHESITREAFGNGILFAIENLKETPKGFYSIEGMLLTVIQLDEPDSSLLIKSNNLEQR